MKKQFRVLSIVCCVFLLILMFAGCGGAGAPGLTGNRYEKKLVGSWYFEGSDEPAFVLYGDGTCEIAYEYGTGTWAVLDDNLLKLSNFYGETETGYILSLEDGVLTLGDGGENESTLYDTPQ